MSEITLPWPHKLLWPNGSVGNRYHKSRETKKHVQWAYSATLAARHRLDDAVRIPVTITVYPKPRGPAPDKDNAQAACKAYLDGIALALGVNDRLFDPRTDIADERRGEIVVKIEGNAL